MGGYIGGHSIWEAALGEKLFDVGAVFLARPGVVDGLEDGLRV